MIKSNQLNFTVFGVARSGTTAFANTLNQHPNIFCSIEFINPKEDHSKINCPDYFHDENVEQNKAKKNRTDISKKSEIASWGNKFPRYYYYLNQLTNQVPKIKHLGIYRENFEHCWSWTNRANALAAWNPGRTGKMAILEQILMFQKMTLLSKPENVYLYSYSHLFSEHVDAWGSVFTTLGVKFTDQMRETIACNYLKNVNVREKTRGKTPFEMFATGIFEISRFDCLLQKHSGINFSNWKESFDKYARFTSTQLPFFLEELNLTLNSHEKEYLLNLNRILIETFPEHKKIIKSQSIIFRKYANNEKISKNATQVQNIP